MWVNKSFSGFPQGELSHPQGDLQTEGVCLSTGKRVYRWADGHVVLSHPQYSLSPSPTSCGTFSALNLGMYFLLSDSSYILDFQSGVLLF